MKSLNKKNFLSFVTLFGFLILFTISFFYVQNEKESGGASRLHRYSFMMNEKLWKSLQGKSLSVKKKNPGKGKLPRVNGDLGLKSELNIRSYKIEVVSGETRLHLPVSSIKILPKKSYATDFRCIEGWSEEVQYGGVPFSVFMDAYDLGRKADGTYYNYVALETPDREYYVSLDMESMLHPQTMLAYEMNEHELSLENGYPLRLIIPIKYGIKSLKRIGKIYFSDTRPPDFWAERGYDWYSGL